MQNRGTGNSVYVAASISRRLPYDTAPLCLGHVAKRAALRVNVEPHGSLPALGDEPTTQADNCLTTNLLFLLFRKRQKAGAYNRGAVNAQR